MITSVAASHAKGKFATDRIFGANAAANRAAAKYGKENVVNATIGVLLDNEEKLVCLPTVEKVYHSVPMTEVVNYAPIAGVPEYLEAAIDLTFFDQRPDAYIKAVATAGGSGAIHHVVWNYSEIGDTLLTADWYWAPYKVLCEDALRKLDTFPLFDADQNFNVQGFAAKVTDLLAKQNNLVVFMNMPAHNPTGYSLTDEEWAQALGVCKEQAKNQDKRIIVVVDAAYIDYAGEKNACRSFMKQFGGLPANILVIIASSLSKSYTLYGQRVGAMIGVTSSQEIAKEFEDINQYTSRATWSNINRGVMRMAAMIYQDKGLLAQVEAERNGYYKLIQERAGLFAREAQEVGLKMLPFKAGFFLSIPSQKSEAVCEKLYEENVFAVALPKGIRIAVCAVPTRKMAGMAAKIVKAKAAVGDE